MSDHSTDAPATSERSGGEFRRYRQGLSALYLVVAGLGVALLVGSVLRGLFFAGPAEAATQTELRECERDLTRALERMRAHIPAHLAHQLSPEGDREPGPDGRIQSSARIVARCARATNSPVDRAIREAADALGDLDRGFRKTSSQFQRDVAANVTRADNALVFARKLLGQELKSP